MASDATTQQAEQARALLSGLGCHVLRPDDAAFEERIGSYWSDYNRVRPWCIVQPRTADEVSRAVTALAGAGVKFAIRSGGHTTWAGASSIEDGVTVDLGLMADTTVRDPGSAKVASIGPGARWRDVYDALEPHGLTVAGGRDGDVGVGGLVTGGGNSFFTSRCGMTCDSVVNFQVVLADGRVVDANKDENADLFQVLKGGSSNFGIVTRIDMQAFDYTTIFAGPVISPKAHTAGLAEAFVHFTDNVEENRESSFAGVWTYTPQAKDIIIYCLHTNLDGSKDEKPFEKFGAVGPCNSMMGEVKISAFVRQISMPPGQREIWFTLTFKNDLRIVNKAIAGHEAMVEKLKALMPDGNFSTQCVLQPLPTLFARHSVERGGNVLGLDQVTDNAVLWLGTVSVPTKELGDAAYELLRTYTAETEAHARELGLDVPWRHLNYADPSQQVLATYGATNVEKMRAAAKKYDPDGVFQTLMPGGFKISKV
ncbi:hypothetical protein RB595_003830 [Gaeumannomyces hyphopodioides]